MQAVLRSSIGRAFLSKEKFVGSTPTEPARVYPACDFPPLILNDF